MQNFNFRNETLRIPCWFVRFFLWLFERRFHDRCVFNELFILENNKIILTFIIENFLVQNLQISSLVVS